MADAELPDNARLIDMKPFPWAVGFHEEWDATGKRPGLTSAARDIVSRVQLLASQNGVMQKSGKELAGLGADPKRASRVVRALHVSGWLRMLRPHDPTTSSAAVYQLTRPCEVSMSLVFDLFAAVITADPQRSLRARKALEKEYGDLGAPVVLDTPTPDVATPQGQTEEEAPPGCRDTPPPGVATPGPPGVATPPPLYVSVMNRHGEPEVGTETTGGAGLSEDSQDPPERHEPPTRPGWLPSARSSIPHLVAHTGQGKRASVPGPRGMLPAVVRDDGEQALRPDEVPSRAAAARAAMNHPRTDQETA